MTEQAPTCRSVFNAGLEIYARKGKDARRDADKHLRDHVNMLTVEEWLMFLKNGSLDENDAQHVMAAGVLLGAHEDAGGASLQRVAELLLVLLPLPNTTAYRVLDGARRLLGKGHWVPAMFGTLEVVRHFEQSGGDETRDVARRVRALIEKNLGTKAPSGPPSHNEDFSVIFDWYDGRRYQLKGDAPAIVRVLWSVYEERRNPELTTEELKRLITDNGDKAPQRPDDVLKRQGLHPEVVSYENGLFKLAFRAPFPPRKIQS